ncbi:MAG: hypothetical protein FWH48_02480, partial [Oscillospiraceae bacterium]|nr:hypothetical protein [Oscillospiraceae bacterium]
KKQKRELKTGESQYQIEIEVTLPERGLYIIHDRLENNMRYMGTDSADYYITNPEKQFVDIYIYAKNGGTLTVSYDAVKISEAGAVTEKAYISQNFDIDDIWGASN